MNSVHCSHSAGQFRDAALKKGCWDCLGRTSDWTQLGPLCKLLRFWQAIQEIHWLMPLYVTSLFIKPSTHLLECLPLLWSLLTLPIWYPISSFTQQAPKASNQHLHTYLFFLLYLTRVHSNRHSVGASISEQKSVYYYRVFGVLLRRLFSVPAAWVLFLIYTLFLTRVAHHIIQ